MKRMQAKRKGMGGVQWAHHRHDESGKFAQQLHRLIEVGEPARHHPELPDLGRRRLAGLRAPLHARLVKKAAEMQPAAPGSLGGRPALVAKGLDEFPCGPATQTKIHTMQRQCVRGGG